MSIQVSHIIIFHRPYARELIDNRQVIDTVWHCDEVVMASERESQDPRSIPCAENHIALRYRPLNKVVKHGFINKRYGSCLYQSVNYMYSYGPMEQEHLIQGRVQ